MKKKKKDYPPVYINVDREPLLEVKPSKELRPKCINCQGTILLRTTWWYPGSGGYTKAPKKYHYDGIGYFCCRNCAQQYGIEAARKALGHPEFNNVK